MEKLKPKTIKCIAGSGKLLLYTVILMELVLGSSVVALGIVQRKGWMLAVGFAVAIFGLFSAAGTRLAPLGDKLLWVSKDHFYLSSYLGLQIDKDNYGWIEKTVINQRAGKKTLLIYTNDKSIFEKSAYIHKSVEKKSIQDFSSAVAINESDIERLGVNRFDLEELNETINVNRMLEKINSLDDITMLSSRFSINDKVVLFYAGKEIQFYQYGMMLKPIGDEEITVFLDNSLMMVSTMISKKNNIRDIVLILLYESTNFLLVSSENPIFDSLLDSLLNMDGFDISAYNDAYEKAEDILCICYNQKNIFKYEIPST